MGSSKSLYVFLSVSYASLFLHISETKESLIMKQLNTIWP